MSGTTTIVGNGAIQSLTVNTNGVLFETQFIGIGENQGGNGALTILNKGTVGSGGSITAGGNNATGLVLVQAGGTLETTGTLNPLAYVLAVGNGAATTSAAGVIVPASSGTISVAGTGALLTTNGNPAAIGPSGIGTLLVVGGAHALFGSSSVTGSNAALAVGNAGSGSVIVSGVGSTLTAAGDAYLAHSGTGSLTVSNFGSFFGGDAVDSVQIGNGNTNGTGGTGFAFVTTGGYLNSADNVVVGYGGDTGTLDVGSGGKVEAANRVLVGLPNTINGTTIGGTGFLDVTAGGTVQADALDIPSSGTSGIGVGDGIGSTGSVTVTGAGALLTAGGQYMVIGNIGTGAVTVSQGGSVATGTPFLADAAVVIGSGGGVGALTVTDPNSTFTAVGQMNVGSTGTGSLLVANGATVATGGNTIAPGFGFIIGWGTASSGSVTVTGTGSEIINNGRFDVGGSGNSGLPTGGPGALTIANGGQVITSRASASLTAPAADIGTDPGTGGSAVTVSGANSKWQVSGPLVVGDDAVGTLMVASGGTVTASQIDAGVTAGTGSGVIDLTGADSQLNVAGLVMIGDAGTASLTIGNAGTLDAGTLTIGAGDAVSLLGGLLESLSSINNSGTISATAGLTEIGGAILGAGSLTVGSAGSLRIDGPVSAGQTVAFAGSGGTLTLEQPGQFAAMLAGFQSGDVIDAVGATGGTVSGNVLTLFSATGTLGTLTLSNPPPNLSIAGGGGTVTVSDGTPPTSSDVTVTAIAGGFQYTAGNLNDVVNTAAGNSNNVNLGTGQDSVYSAGTDTIFSGTGTSTIAATANAVAFAKGPLTFTNGGGSSIVVMSTLGSVTGGSGKVEVFGGTGTLNATGGAAGANGLVAGGGNATLTGGGNGDLFVGGSAGSSDVINIVGASAVFAGAASVSINGGAGNGTFIGGAGPLSITNGTGANVLFGGTGQTTIKETTGSDLVLGGQGMITINQSTGVDGVIMGAGNMVLNEGAGSDIIALFSGGAGGSLTVNGFKVGTDIIYLGGYAASEQTNALANAAVTAAGTTLSFSDGTRITLAGITNVGSNVFYP